MGDAVPGTWQPVEGGSSPDESVDALRHEISRLHAEADETAAATAAETARVQEVHDEELLGLRAVIDELLADALQATDARKAEAARVQQEHDAETADLRGEIADLQAEAERARLGDPLDDATTALRAEIARLTTAAAQLAVDTAAETARVDELHQRALHHLEVALSTRDTFGQAKGIIMAATNCTADEAWSLIVEQSQAENRKAVDIATEITSRVPRRPDVTAG